MRTRKIRLIVALFTASVLCAGLVARAQDAALDDAFKALPEYKIGQSRKALDTIQQAVVAAQLDAAKRAALAGRLASFLSTDATFEAKDFCCRQLYIIGTKAEIPAVARLLGDEKLSHMSRYVLEAMADPEADAAMRQAMGTLQGKLLIGVVNSLGNRRNAASTAAFVKMLAGDDPALAAAAAAALGKIGGEEAIKALAAQRNNAAAEVKAAVADAYLLCADQLLRAGQEQQAAALYTEMMSADQPMRLRMAALRGLVAAAPEKAMPLVLANLKSGDAASQAMACGFARQIPGADVTKAFAAALPALNPAGQVLLIDALASRGDAGAKPAILAAARSSEDAVRVAAITALGAIGDASDVAALAALAAKAGAEREAARTSLARVRGEGIDAAIIAAMQGGSPELRVECCKALAARRATSATQTLAGIAAKDDAEPVRCAATEALGLLIEDKDFPMLVDRLLAAKSPAERTAAENAMSTASLRMKNRDDSVPPIVVAMEKATPDNKKVLLNALAKMGGPKPLEAVRAAMKDSDPQVQETATRCIASWPDALAIPDMLNIAKSGDAKFRVLAIRGLVGVIQRTQGRTPAENLSVYKQMLEIAAQPAEKKLVIAGIGDIRAAGAFDLLSPLLADDAVKAEAATAIIKVVRNVRNAGARGKAALQKVIDANISADLTNQAKAAMKP